MKRIYICRSNLREIFWRWSSSSFAFSVRSSVLKRSRWVGEHAPVDVLSFRCPPSIPPSPLPRQSLPPPAPWRSRPSWRSWESARTWSAASPSSPHPTTCEYAFLLERKTVRSLNVSGKLETRLTRLMLEINH